MDAAVLPVLEVRCTMCEGRGWADREREPCAMCGGSGLEPTEAGERVLALVRHNFRRLHEAARAEG